MNAWKTAEYEHEIGDIRRAADEPDADDCPAVWPFVVALVVAVVLVGKIW